LLRAEAVIQIDNDRLNFEEMSKLADITYNELMLSWATILKMWLAKI